MEKIQHIEQKEALFACTRFTMHRYTEVQTRLLELRSVIPENIISGPPILIHHYVSSVAEGTLVELGFPVRRKVTKEDIITRTLQRVKCLSISHTGPIEQLSDVYGALFSYSGEKGIISDEYGIEILHDIKNLNNCIIEARLVVHPWENLFRENLIRTLGEEESNYIFDRWETLSTHSDLNDRFEKVKKAVGRLEETADEFDIFDCVSSCAHVFPKEQVQKLRNTFLKAREQGHSGLEAVDRVIEFMDSDPGWGEKAIREGHTIYSSKGPRNRKAFESAQTPAEKAEAACFCPIIRTKLNDGMPLSFCYCGSGWYRQQWEGATGLPVRVEIISSLLKGDTECRFAIHLPKDL